MTPEPPPTPNGHAHPNGDVPKPNQPAAEQADYTQDEYYEPGETLSRGMNLACSLVLLFFALLSCGFIASVLTSHH
ncbi:MAG TPA: hypothetical protein VFZ25_04760 [Chloroflexota bacterium]|nr:hypothetical protein [Chloroflexota bacterium]